MNDSFDLFWRTHALELKADIVRARNERDALRDVLDKLADGYRPNERKPIVKTLLAFGYNMRQIAAIMQISRPTIYNILKEEECREILQRERRSEITSAAPYGKSA